MTALGSTARWVAAARAAETESERPLFEDPFARALAGDIGFHMLTLSTPKRVAGTPHKYGANPYFSIRTRYFDDALSRVVHERELRQIVLLAAGADTRALRLEWPPGTTIYEVDRDDVFEWKEAILADLNVSCGHRRIVRADLTGDWIGALRAAGFDPDLPSAFLAEGLLMYLEPRDVESVLQTLASIATPGSWLGADTVSPEMAASRIVSGPMSPLRAYGVQFRSTMANPRLSLAAHGWHGNVISPGHPDANYGRWHAAPTGVTGIPRAYLITANRGVAFAPPAPVPASAQDAPHVPWGDDYDGWLLLEHGRVSLAERRMSPGAAGAQLQRSDVRQFVYVLEGRLAVEFERGRRTVETGCGIEIPPVMAHGFSNETDHAVRFLLLCMRDFQ